MQTKEDLQTKIKKQLAKSLKKHEITPRDLLLILTIFSKADTSEELHLLIELFKDEYPPFLELLDTEKYDTKSEFEHSIHEFISEMVQVNPLLAAKITHEALKKESTLDSISKQFPEFKNFLQNKK
ncbi:MAG: hypothetical protein UR27_C0014G0012 [Candidatus Peregrinibacteria bacterium GW2011_GWA2_33_10]|nr:MAG: hypothetical protein UR27_C0014G0012 [Candidatus Peregrinibacteria bacterium GW2011_GWA2_33_10]KKP38580.1 MAG: hypothetical protein UR30_C0017G0011 [Candidatus Peregrinibacteria bacterium GW2011_GWC2_33_13]OGJ49438.1 MAG: hypothetical protein A2229_00650 [Candidatus Peregrinibacteria bacterium RIFOXYA2_FULL_33_7]